MSDLSQIPQHDAASELWNRALPLIDEALNSTISMETWIRPLRPVTIQDDRLILLAPDSFVCNYAQKFTGLIKNTLATLSPNKMDVELLSSLDELAPSNEGTPVTDWPAYEVGSSPLIEDPTEQKKKAASEGEDLGSSSGGGIFSRYTFDNFIVGPGNSLAHAACVSIATQQSGNSYNPLFLYGGSGLGKTHLMHAIGNHIRANFPNKKVIYIPCEQFVNEFIYTIQKEDYFAFRNKYRNCDFLMIDDIQFIENKEQTQVEFFNTFNTLYEKGSHIILTCDKPPNNLSTLEERLRTRFASGLSVDIQPPNYETRIAIINKRCADHHIRLPRDVIEYIATNIRTNIRELEGAFNTVMAYASLSGEVNLQVAAAALKDIIDPSGASKITDKTIIDIVCSFYGISVDDIKSKRRSNNIAFPRQVAMYLLRTVMDMTYEQIGKYFGNHHSTVMHSCIKIENLIKSDKVIADEVKSIRSSISL